jgi:hypothetical protein
LSELGNLDEVPMATEDAEEIGGDTKDLCIQTLQEIKKKEPLIILFDCLFNLIQRS